MNPKPWYLVALVVGMVGVQIYLSLHECRLRARSPLHIRGARRIRTIQMCLSITGRSIRRGTTGSLILMRAPGIGRYHVFVDDTDPHRRKTMKSILCLTLLLAGCARSTLASGKAAMRHC